MVKYYDFRAWVTISQENDVATIISTLLSFVTENKFADQEKNKEKDEVQEKLYKELYGRSNLIVLDDIWDTNIWDNLRRSFPKNQSPCTVILTTRDLEVAEYATSSNLHTMQVLGDDDSWDLFREKVFGEKEDLDPELERLGRNIVKNCNGLPLAISVISGLLSESDNAGSFWEHVSNDICTVAALEDEQFSMILSLSYDHLPHHLRPCFLYLGAISKGADIRVSRIKRLWAAESFLKPVEDKTPEEAAEEYLEALANRNLLLVLEGNSRGKVKSYGMHDLLKDLCIRRAEEEDFVVCREYGHVTKALEGSIKAQSLRRVIFNNKNLEKELYKKFCIDHPRSPQLKAIAEYIYTEEYGMVSNLLSISKLVRVLGASEMHLRECPEEIFQVVNIRYLSLNCNSLPPLISRFWNLETLIFCPDRSRDIDIPDEICELGRLKHFKIIGEVGKFTLHSTMEKLQTLYVIRETTRVGMTNLIERIRNIKGLGLDLLDHHITDDIDMSSLHNLENLKIQLSLSSISIRFAPSIVKLTLFYCLQISETLMKQIGELSGLIVLKIKDCLWKPVGVGWTTYEAGFPSLQFLELWIPNLKHWNNEEWFH